MDTGSAAWPKLEPLEAWQDTLETVHLWTQIVGKVRLSCMPWINHSWHVPLYVTVRGLSTSLIPYGTRAFEMEFDFRSHLLTVSTPGGDDRSVALRAVSVATFHTELMQALAELDIDPKIMTKPVEIPDPVHRFPEDDVHASYDTAAVERYWHALLHVERVLTRFRSTFAGKVSPVHFFWGAFDLAVTRFSGRTAPKHPGGAPNCADWVMEEAYSHEVSSAGFWPGVGFGEPAFYSYAYPEPDGFRKAAIRPAGATFLEAMGEYVLPYETVRASSNPDGALMDFLQSTYEAAADLAAWDREALERA